VSGRRDRQGAGGTRRHAAAHPRGRRELSLFLLLPLAVVAVIGERLGRRGLTLLAPLAILAIVLGILGLGRPGTRFAGEQGELATPPTAPIVAAAIVPGTAGTVAAAPATATAPDPTIPASAGGQREPTPTAPAPPTQAPPAVAPPTAAKPTSAPNGAVAIQPLVPTATAVPPTPTPRPRGTTIIPILMYHYVRVVTDPKDTIGIGLSVTPDLFARQMQYLADNGYTTLTMQEVYDILAGRKTLPTKPIALTFDDGYRDFYTAAWPVLQQHGFKATNYVITDFIGWDAYMTWPMLQELAAGGQVEIGAHTRSHADLRTLSAATLMDEVLGSKAILETGLGRPVGAFCYPAGFYNAAVIAAVGRANYLTATTELPGAKQNIQAPYELPRIRVNGPDALGAWASRLP
jgi:peptidoglycan/xylan/chitin deacetylase (PgdA/CDA1 family)